MPMWLAVVVICALAGCSTGSADKSRQAQQRLEQIAAGSDRPVYYLGPRFRTWWLTEATIDGDRVDAIYGTCRAITDSCADPIDLYTQAFDPGMWRLAAGCTRLEPVRGVPAVTFGAELVLFTGTSTVTIAPGDDGDTAVARAAAAELREVDGTLSPGPLPPPEPAILPILDGACGHQPGDTGPPADPGPVAAPSTQVPDFTIGQLGGGQLRWADYRGRPVVVVAGDVPYVVRGIQRILHLGAPPPPVVIGLVWKPFGSKDNPAPIAAIEQEARTVSAPVGYAAIPRPAVWLFDMAEADPAKTGVIAFVNADGNVIRHLTTDATNQDLAAALDALKQ
jgi:hypothetical protein